MNQDDINDIDLSSHLIITSELIGENVLLNLEGAITFLTQIDLQKSIKEFQGNGYIKFLINLQKTLFIDSSGLGYFIKFFRELKANNGRVAFIQPIPQIQSVLKNSFGLKVESIIFSSLENALTDKNNFYQN